MLLVSIAEQHVGRIVIDPAAETEVTLMARESGFEVVDPKAGSSKQADILLQGEGFSEFAMRRGNMVSVKARLEVKAVDRATDRVIATDRQTTVVVDLSEEIAGKSALQSRRANRRTPAAEAGEVESPPKFSTVWKKVFHTVENFGRFFHTMEKPKVIFPRHGKYISTRWKMFGSGSRLAFVPFWLNEERIVR